MNFTNVNSNRKIKICVVGLGYVGLPLAVKFAKHFKIVGFDINKKRIEELKNNYDRNLQINKKELEEVSKNIEFTDEEDKIGEANIFIVTVPTPLTENKKPDLSFLKEASKIVGRNLKRGSIVVYESTTYPGCTEEVCLPILEKESRLKLGEFSIGYSPERISPGDKEHTLESTYKIVAGYDEETTKRLSEIYGKITNVCLVDSIKIAEAAKVVENTQRCLNIALFNELARIFDKLKIDSKKVFDAAATKWNFHRYYPGFVGGHCISVDPYYLLEKANNSGYISEFIMFGILINEEAPYFVAKKIIELLKDKNKSIEESKILILGASYKENVPDLRESKVKNLIEKLKSLGIDKINIFEPLIERENIFGVENINKFEKYDVIVYTVNHKEFKNMDISDILKNDGIIIDIRRRFDKQEVENRGFTYWGL